MKYRYESEAMQVVHEEVMDLHSSGLISDAEMREFDEMRLEQEDETANEAEKPLKIEQVTA